MPDIQSKEKLAEAKYFLDGLQSSRALSQVKFNFSAFMSAIHSVMDIMLYDCSEAFSLGISRDMNRRPVDFKVAAVAKESVPASKFIIWWEEEMAKYISDPLWRTRHKINHRGYPGVSVSQQFVYVSGTIISAEDIPNFAVAAVSGRSNSWGPPGVPRPRESEPGFTLDGFPDMALSDLCQSMFDRMEATVNIAEKLFL